MVPSRALAVAGVVSYDYLIYPMATSDVNAPSEHQLVIRTGDAHLVAQLLAAVAPNWNIQVHGPTLQHGTSNVLKNNASSIVDLSCDTSSSQPPERFEIVQQRQIGKAPIWHQPPTEQAASTGIHTAIIMGSGEAFFDVEPALDFLQRVRPKYIINQMTRPLAAGKLWDILRNASMIRDGVPDPDHLAVIVEADDLRSEGIALSQLSWESFCEDFVRNLGSNGRLDTLVTCPNLIVRFAGGVIHHRGRDAVEPRLYFPTRSDGKGHARMIGLESAFTAGFALGFPDCELGIKLGMAAARRLSETGLTLNQQDSAPDYDIKSIVNDLHPEKGVSVVSIPSNRISSGDRFSIFDSLTGHPSEVARQIVVQGPERALARCPVRKFGKMQIVDRTEMESLGAIVDTIQERLRSAIAYPTCIGMLGPVGSGKKFVASNVTEAVSETWSIKQLDYNARAMKAEDLVNLCNTIRDHVAVNRLTVVTFENFEALLHKDSTSNTLLDDFVALMRYGEFNEGGHCRSVGKCVLIFMVNQEPSKLESTPTPTKTEFNLNRAVDDSPLLDNLHGVVSLLGPNQTSPQDKLFPVRRALMLRQLLKNRLPQLEVNGTMNIDSAVLHALLFVPQYKHGLRSLEKIVSTSRLSGRTKYDVSALPPEEQIQLHVDGPTFMGYLRSPKLLPTLRERLAEELFEAYKIQRVKNAKTEAQKKELAEDRAMVDWDELSGELKESTRAQADDIPRKLRAIGCFMLNEERSKPLIRVTEFNEEDLHKLSIMEHERFNAERLQRQWRMGPRNPKMRMTPFIKPWRDLDQDIKDLDTCMVEIVPRVLASADYRIYKYEEEEE